MPLRVSDTNILYDLKAGGITRSFFELGDAIAVPDLLFVEELETDAALSSKLVRLGLRVLWRTHGGHGRHARPEARDRLRTHASCGATAPVGGGGWAAPTSRRKLGPPAARPNSAGA